MTGTHAATGNLFGSTAVITCPHGGRAAPAAAPASDAVLLDGLPVATASGAYPVTGCTRTVHGTPAPCTGVRWGPDPEGVLVDGVPVLLDVTAAQCFDAALLPTGRALVAPAQRGVMAG